MTHLRRLGVGAMALAFGWQVALAHSHLESSMPKDGAMLSKAPTEVRLSFEEAVKITAVNVVGADGKKHAVKISHAAVKDFSAPLKALSPGKYTIHWRALSDDGHVMSGKISFTVGK